MELEVPTARSVADIKDLTEVTGSEVPGFLVPRGIVTQILGLSAHDLAGQFGRRLPFDESVFTPLASVFFDENRGLRSRYIETPSIRGTAGHTEKLAARRFLHFSGQTPEADCRYFGMALTEPLGFGEMGSVETAAKLRGRDFYVGFVEQGDIIYMLSGGIPSNPHNGLATMHEFEGKGKYLKIWEANVHEDDDEEDDEDDDTL